jgi:hypothetical protein
MGMNLKISGANVWIDLTWQMVTSGAVVLEVGPERVTDGDEGL